MGFIQAYKMAVKSIVSNKARSFLTMLGVIIGVGAVIAAVGFAKGSTKGVTDTIEGLGTNLIQISITGRNSNRKVTFKQLEEFVQKNNGMIQAVAPQMQGSATLKAGNKSMDTTVIGTSADYETIRNRKVQSGRFLMFFDTDFRQKVVLLGTAVVNELFEGRDPIEETVKINGNIFKVVGVLEETAGGQEQSEDDRIIIPVTTAQRLMRMAQIRNFAIQATAPQNVDDAMELLDEFLYKIYRDESSYRVFNQAQVLDILGDITDIMTVILAGIATISLVVGGIGIMNIMLVSVTERTREIGIRKAVGAKKRSILIQFLIEALIVTGIGGIIGILLGTSVIKFILGGFNLVPEVYSLEWIIISFGISLCVGVIFGMFPAYKAANLNPIEALRYE